MHRRHGPLVFSPSDLIVFLESPFASWMDRYHLEHPGVLVPDAQDAESALVAKMGTEHEERELAALRAAGRDVWTPPERARAFEDTLEAMRAGRDVIYQAALRRAPFEGYADFLLRVERPSSLGAHSYEVADTKLARRPKPYFLIQLCAYAAMLEDLQGARPDQVHVVTGDGARHALRTDDYFHYFRAVERAFRDAQDAFDPEARPLPDASAEHRRWTSHAERLLEERDHPSRVATITSVQIKRLADAGITTMTALAGAALPRVPRMEDRVFARLRRQAQLQIASAGQARPAFELVEAQGDDARRGLACLPPPSPGDVFFDMEGYPFMEGGLEYLFGAIHREPGGAGGEPRFYEQWAHDRPSEKRAFEAFVDWVWARFEADPSMHVYHYAPYEVTALRRLMGQHGTREETVDALLRAEVFVDLYRIVRQSVLVGEPRYSLKNVEHLYRPRRAGEVSTAGESVTEYARWLEAPDGPDHASSAILRGIRAYNEEDCASTLELRDWLLARQREVGVAYVPAVREARDRAPRAEGDEARADVARALLDGIPEDTTSDPERWRIRRLLADVVDFHRRELKPVYWAMYDRRDRSHEELAEDPDCLGDLKRTAKAPTKDKQSLLYEYAFDPDQETKLGEGTCLLSHDLSSITLHALDATRGLAVLRRGAGLAAPPANVSLVPQEVVRPSPVDTAVRDVVAAYAATGTTSGALETLLRRCPPRIRGERAGSPVAALRPGDDATAAVTKAIVNLDRSTLAIQGPPGSGKTTTAARAIVELLRRGHRVGVTSNGHKAIEKLMGDVLDAARSVNVAAVKIGRKEDDPLASSGRARHAASMRDVDLDDDGPNLVGGTAWAFCHEAASGAFDYLFVDEASQVPLANVVGMSRATENVVLLGDPMQLSQPTKGAHPGESGQSALGYLLGGHRTIPDELGVFLATSWRLHPDVCRVVSDAVYEGRFVANPTNARRVVRVPSAGARHVRAEAGVLFVPTPHEGNAQASEEEVRAIVEIVGELVGRTFIDGSGERPLRRDDILVVAPYNMQVRALSSALPGIRIGSVDKFQGQEAPVAIVSMCASSGEAVTRGLEFLFSPNRMNVALSRAQSLAIVVGSPALARARVSTVEQMRLVDFFCRVAERVGPPDGAE